MEDFRSKPYGVDGGMQMEEYDGQPNSCCVNSMQALRSFSVSSVRPAPPQNNNELGKFKKGKSTNSMSSKAWSFNDPELKRKKRVAGYKVYSVEGKLKGSLKKSFRWIKDKCSSVVHGW